MLCATDDKSKPVLNDSLELQNKNCVNNKSNLGQIVSADNSVVFPIQTALICPELSQQHNFYRQQIQTFFFFNNFN